MPAIHSTQIPKSRPHVQSLTIACCSGALMLCACSGGGESASDTSTFSPSPAITPPVISGSPPTFVMQDVPYEFTPPASDADGDTLTFTIAEQPASAAFNASTGRLTGTSAAADVGSTLAVIVSVSYGTASTSLPTFDLEVGQIELGSAMVFWDASATNADGSQLTDLGGLRVYDGLASGNYTTVLDVSDAAAVSLLIDELEPDTYFVAVSALDNIGNESALSAEVSKVVAP